MRGKAYCAECSNASYVDIYGIKLEGSTPIMWVRDSYDVNLLGLGGSGDAFPNCGGATGRPSQKTHLLRHLYIKMIILPRQARDKHRGKLKKEMRSRRDGPAVQDSV